MMASVTVKMRITVMWLAIAMLALMAGSTGPARAATPPSLDPLVLYTASLRPTQPFLAKIRVDMPTGTAHLEMFGSGSDVYVRSGKNWPMMGEHGMMSRPAGQVFKKDEDTLVSTGLLSRNYEINVENGDTFLGRPTYRVTLSPKWKGSIRRTVLVDRDTLVQLKSEDRDHADQLVQRREVITIDFTPDSNRLLSQTPDKPSLEPDRYATLAEAEALLGFTLAMPGYLPPGFALYGVRISPARSEVAHLVFTDGLTIISLFERKVPWWARLAQRSKRLAEHGYEAAGNGLSHYLVGDIPFEELRRIIESIS